MIRRIHSRTDLQFTVIRGHGYFCRRAYACVITQSTAYPDERAIFHIETFYGDDGVKLRAEARRYGSAVCKGRRIPGPYRSQHLPHGFPSQGLPKREDQIAIR